MNTKTILPPEGEEYLLKPMNLKLRVDYRIAGRVEDELRRIFVTEQIVGGGLNILAYQKNETQTK